MIKSVLSTVPSHSTMCFKLPKNLTKRIQSALTRYWWNASPEERKIWWVAWSELAKSKKDGGLGFRKVEAFNDALLAKQSWRILNKPDCLLAKLLLGKYCKATNFMAVQASSSCSNGWRSVLCGRDLLLEKTGKVIGNGADTRIWDEPWFSTSEIAQPMGPPDLETKDLTVADLLDQPSGTWNRELVSHIFPAAAPSILCLRPSIFGALDKHCWLPTKDGEYSTRTGYFTALEMKTQASCLLHLKPMWTGWRIFAGPSLA